MRALEVSHFMRYLNSRPYILTYIHKKMVNGFRYYRALECVSIASALSTALTIYPCQIRVHRRWQSILQLPTARKKEWRPATAGSSPPCGYLSTLWYTTLVGLEPTTSRSLVRRAASSATEPTNQYTYISVYPSRFSLLLCYMNRVVWIKRTELNK